jgi:hypothetical protein
MRELLRLGLALRVSSRALSRLRQRPAGGVERRQCRCPRGDSRCGVCGREERGCGRRRWRGEQPKLAACSVPPLFGDRLDVAAELVEARRECDEDRICTALRAE